MTIALEAKQPKYFLKENISRKLFKNEIIGKKLASRVISEVIGLDYNDVYNNIKLSSEDISFSAKTLSSNADVIYASDSIIIDIEVNSYNSPRKKRQLESYIFQLHLGQLKNHKDYVNMKKIFQINIDNYDLLGKNEFIYEIGLMDKKYHEVVSDIIQITHINLDYLRNLDYTSIKENKLMKNLYIFICGKLKLNNLIEDGDEFMKDSVKEVQEILNMKEFDFYLTDEEILELDRQDMINELREEVKNEVREEVENEVREEVKNETRKEKEREMIKEFYKNSVSLDLISKSTGLSIKEIEQIIKEN
ncbi:MAG: Rpn family recombination-promoting nuclease/putative transposase [Bacilli bacterium]|nr:Rpn family recombination-promoting nuclease/putative transposase [Bacilli bacterium]